MFIPEHVIGKAYITFTVQTDTERHTVLHCIKYPLLLCTDHQIMADLLAHETKQTSQQIPATSFGPLAGVAISATATEYSSSSSSEDEGMMEVYVHGCMKFYLYQTQVLLF